jgi:hypothetical protein
MKSTALILLAIILHITASCSSDDSKGSHDTTTIDPANFQGQLLSGESATLDPAQEYILTGTFIVREGATLTIPAGTLIKATGGTSAYIAVAQGGKIFINGTATDPVVMTSGKTSPAPGDWGGLVICGKARTNKGGANGQTATAEVSDLTYGGSIDNDSSGSIRYLRIEYTGAAFTNEKEFNGVSLFAVGSGTIFEYVQSYEGGDDGIEFFGGSVHGRYLISTGSQDDSIDFADGWSGTGEYWYIKNGAKAGIEGSNNGDNGAALPTTNATLRNISIVGGGSEGALFIKEGGGKWNASNIYISGFAVGINIKDAAGDPVANQHIDNNEITFTNIQFDDVTQNSKYSGLNSSYLTTGNSSGAGNWGDAPSWAQGWTRI